MKLTNAYQAQLARLGGNADVTVQPPVNKYEKLLGDIQAGGGSSGGRLVVVIDEDGDENQVSSVSYDDLVAAIDAHTEIAVYTAWDADPMSIAEGCAGHVAYDETAVYLYVSRVLLYDGPRQLGPDVGMGLMQTLYTVNADRTASYITTENLSSEYGVVVPFTLSGSTATFSLNLRQITAFLADSLHVRFSTHKNDSLSLDTATPWYEFEPVEWIRKSSNIAEPSQFKLVLQRVSVSGSTMTVETVTMSNADASTGTYSIKNYTLTAAEST